MNRWTIVHIPYLPFSISRALGPKWAWVVFLLGLICTEVALCQALRSFPARVQRAELQITQSPDILLNAKAARLAPGARIRAENDLLVLPASLVGQKLTVNFLLEPGGLVKDVWILSPAEAAQPSAL